MSGATRIERFGAFCLPLAPGLTIALYWILSLVGGESFSVAATYRYGDYNYFPPLAGLMNFTLGEWLVLEHVGEGLRSFPFPSLAFHGAALLLFGPVGFAIADVAVAIGAYLAAGRLFRNCGLSHPTSAVLALVVSCGLVGWPGSQIQALFESAPVMHLWGLRFPRPFLTDLFLMLCVGSWMRIFIGRIENAREWAVFGFWFALLLQSRYYSAATVGLALGIAAPMLLLRPGGLKGTLRSLAIFGGVTGLTSLPFAVQRIYENPELPARFGAFAVDRSEPIFLDGAGGHVVTAACFTAVALAAIYASRVAVSERPTRTGASIVLLVMSGLSVVALPISTILLGQTIQPYHFRIEALTFKALVLIVSVGHILDLLMAWFLRLFPALSLRPWLGRAIVATVAVSCVLAGASLHRRWIDVQWHARRDFPAYRVKDYRSEFRALTDELGRDQYASARVLGTLDIQVLDWWSLFGGMHVFNPEPCSTNISDDEIEDRLLRFFRVVGVEPRAIPRLINDSAVLIFFLGCAKYQVSSATSFAPLHEYSAKIQQRAARSSPLSSWLIALPRKETRRLAKRYKATPEGRGDLELDLIVLGPGPLDEGLMPSPREYRLTYRNRLFRVYVRSDNQDGGGET